MLRSRRFFDKLRKDVVENADSAFERAQGVLAVEQARQFQRYNRLLLACTIAITLATLASAYFQSPFAPASESSDAAPIEEPAALEEPSGVTDGKDERDRINEEAALPSPIDSELPNPPAEGSK